MYRAPSSWTYFYSIDFVLQTRLSFFFALSESNQISGDHKYLINRLAETTRGRTMSWPLRFCTIMFKVQMHFHPLSHLSCFPAPSCTLLHHPLPNLPTSHALTPHLSQFSYKHRVLRMLTPSLSQHHLQPVWVNLRRGVHSIGAHHWAQYHLMWHILWYNEIPSKANPRHLLLFTSLFLLLILLLQGRM